MPLPLPTPTANTADVDKHQNPWSVLNDYSKTIVTLASSILAVTATFAGTILGATAPQYLVGLILASWLFLILTIGFSMYATGALTRYLRTQITDTHRLILFSNLSFFALALALILFAVAGGIKLWSTTKKFDISSAIRTLSSFTAYPDVSQQSLSRASILAMKWNESTNQWVSTVSVSYTQDGTPQSKSFKVTLNNSGDAIVSIEAVP